MLAGIATVLVGNSRAEIDPPEARRGVGVGQDWRARRDDQPPARHRRDVGSNGWALPCHCLAGPSDVHRRHPSPRRLALGSDGARIRRHESGVLGLARPWWTPSKGVFRCAALAGRATTAAAAVGWSRLGRLVADTVPVWAIMLAVLLLAARRDKGGDRPTRGFIAFTAALAVLSIVGLTTLDINGAPPESHRFLTAALFLFPLFGVLGFDRWPLGSLGRTLVMSALTLGAISGLFWLSHSPRHPTPSGISSRGVRTCTPATAVRSREQSGRKRRQ